MTKGVTLYLPLEKCMAFHLKKDWIPFTQEYFVSSSVVNAFSLCRYYMYHPVGELESASPKNALSSMIEID